MTGKMTGIILAGGRSSRMGTDKGLVQFNGKPLIRYSLDIFLDLCSEILISTNSKGYDHPGVRVVSDIIPDSGPMAGIYSCLLQSTNEINLVLPCDMPFVTADIFRHLLEKIGNSMICVPWHGSGRYEPLCGIYRRSVLPLMKEFMEAKNLKLPDLFKCASFTPLLISDIRPRLNEHYFFSINSQDELNKNFNSGAIC